MEASAIFIKFLQACITPVAMISGVGLLLLTITNRLARTVDRTRLLVTELDDVNIPRRESKKNGIKILYKRSKLLRNSIAWLMIGVLSSCLIIPLLFIMSFVAIDLRMIGYALFFISIMSLFISSIYFFRDILLGLHAIKLEASEYIK
jgi:hypothetical protein